MYFFFNIFSFFGFFYSFVVSIFCGFKAVIKINGFLFILNFVLLIIYGWDVIVIGNYYFFDITSVQLFLINNSISLFFFIDKLTIGFYGILLFSLIICFFFINQYFEYDSNGKSIVLLSIFFSQLAYFFFSSGDVFLLIFFWELISIVSFFLIQFWVSRLSTLKVALKVFILSQVGDIFFFLSVFIILSLFETTDMVFINKFVTLVHFLFFYFFNFCISGIFLASIGLIFALFLKSAQFIFFPWLLDAMEAPVPISAQLHSSTLVIIGFYVFYRFYGFFLNSQFSFYLLFFFSFFTIISSSILGFFQNDCKKLLACSTASQLGYSILSFSIGLDAEGFVLLVFCSCNKAIVFVWVGIIMDKSGGVSDIRLIGSLNYFFFEKSGLICSILSSTIIPGSFGWHVKGLISRGFLLVDSFFFLLAIGLLSLTWFFSSLYLFSIVVRFYVNPTNNNRLTPKGTFFFVSTKSHFSFVFYFFLLFFQISLFGFSFSYLLIYPFN